MPHFTLLDATTAMAEGVADSVAESAAAIHSAREAEPIATNLPSS